MTTQNVLIGGRWREANQVGTFQAEDPRTGESLPDVFPVSSWEDCDDALAAASCAAEALGQLPASRRAEFLECFADCIEKRSDALVAMAESETALPATPRLADIELPRTTAQLRAAAAAAREGSWAHVTIDTRANIRSWYGSLGPIAVFGPNNFPFAFGSLSGGDFAAAIAAGNPVIGKANSSHPGTTRIFAEEAHGAAEQTEMPPGLVQLIYRLGHADGERLVADARLGATGYTGSRSAGLKLKDAADRAGKPIYLELSSVNPVIVLPGALQSRLEEIADEFTTSCLMGTGQFCTNPGLVLLLRGPHSESFVQALVERFAAAAVGTLLSRGVQRSLLESVQALQAAGAELLVGGTSIDSAACRCENTLLKVSGARFLTDPAGFHREAFGNASLLVIADDADELSRVLRHLEGNLTGCVYSDAAGRDDDAYGPIATILRSRVGRLLNDQMPTGVAVSPAMNHGGPYPATGHPGFTAVGIPAALQRFAMLQCYDNVRSDRLPAALRDENPTGAMWRLIDGTWTQDDVQR